MTPTTTRNFALLIGVSDYASYDESAGLPPGTSDVPGAHNDVRAWYETCLAMGFSPENIRVLTSPELSASKLGPGAERATLGDATHGSMVEGLEWLGAQLDTAEPVSGLLCFFGHGVQGEADLPALCPSDITVSLDQLIQLSALAPDRVKANLTMMLDCCHAQAGETAAKSVAQSLAKRLRARLSGVAMEPAPAARPRIVAACRWDQTSVVARFHGRDMGAFTWAMTSTLTQWSTVIDDGVAYLDLSYRQLNARGRALLESLSFVQQPVLSGPDNVLRLAYLQPGSEPKETFNVPTASRQPLQLDSGNYQLTYLDGQGREFVIANIEVPEGSSTETWTVYTDQLAAGVNGEYTLRLYNYQPRDPTGTNTVEQTTAQTTDWTSAGANPPYPAGSYSYLSETTIDNTNYDTSMSFTLTTSSDGTVLQTILWYNSDDQGGVAFAGPLSVRVFPSTSDEFPSATAYQIDSEYSDS